jgi:hypothetical protein
MKNHLNPDPLSLLAKRLPSGAMQLEVKKAMHALDLAVAGSRDGTRFSYRIEQRDMESRTPVPVRSTASRDGCSVLHHSGIPHPSILKSAVQWLRAGSVRPLSPAQQRCHGCGIAVQWLPHSAATSQRTGSNKASIQYLNNLRQTSLGAYHQIF